MAGGSAVVLGAVSEPAAAVAAGARCEAVRVVRGRVRVASEDGDAVLFAGLLSRCSSGAAAARGVVVNAEKRFQAAIVQLAGLLGWRVFYVRDSRGSPGGWPDLTLCKCERLLVRELKTTTGRLSREQAEWGRALTAAGVDWRVWTPADWPTIEATLKGQLEIGGAA